MTNKSRYWLTMSGLLAATVLTIGFAPVPLLFILGGLLVGGFIAAGVLYGQFQLRAIRSGASFARFPVVATIIAFNLTLFARGSDRAGLLVPAMAVALFTACHLWSRKNGPYLEPAGSPSA